MVRRVLLIITATAVALAGLVVWPQLSTLAAGKKATAVSGWNLPATVTKDKVVTDRFRVSGPKKRVVVLQHRKPGGKWRVVHRGRTSKTRQATVRVTVVRSAGRWVWKAGLRGKRWTTIARTTTVSHDFRIKVPAAGKFKRTTTRAERIRVVLPPTPKPGPVTIMPIGDSITQSRAYRSTYRCHLDRMLRDAGAAFDFLGSRSEPWDGPPYECPHDFDQDHEGYWGGTIEEVGSWAMPAVKGLKPDVALVHLGTNDLAGERSAADAATDLRSLITNLQAAQPDITVLVAQIIPCRIDSDSCDEGRWTQFHGLVSSFGSLSTGRSSVVVVDMRTGFDREYLYDNVHPNDAGDQFMAGRWLRALSKAGLT